MNTKRPLLAALLLLAVGLAAPLGPASASHPAVLDAIDTRCDTHTCITLRLDDQTNPSNRLDTTPAGSAASADIYWGNGRLLRSDTNNAIDGTLTVDGTIHSTTGGVKFPDGTTQATAVALDGFQAGRVNVGTSESVFTVTFDTPYSTAPVVVVSSQSSVGARPTAHLHHIEVVSVTSAQFTFWREGHDGSTSGLVNWMAMPATQ